MNRPASWLPLFHKPGITLATGMILWYPNFAVELKQERSMKNLMIGQSIGTVPGFSIFPFPGKAFHRIRSFYRLRVHFRSFSTKMQIKNTL